MEPGLYRKEKILAFPLIYGIKLPFVPNRLQGIGCPQRGDLVIVIPPYYPDIDSLGHISDPFIRFFSLQKAIPPAENPQRGISKYMVKRIIGLPGDTIEIRNFTAYIKVPDSDFQKENILAPVSYTIRAEVPLKALEDWPQELPFSGNMAPITLKEDQFFVLGDNRSHSSDSRSWGPIHFNNLVGKVLFRYWPLSRLGNP